MRGIRGLSFNCVVVASSAMVAVSSSAFGGLVPAVEVAIEASDGTFVIFSPNGSSVGGDIYNFEGSAEYTGFSINWDFDVDPSLGGDDKGAFVGNGFDITSLADVKTDIEITVTMPLDSGGAGLDYFGSIGYTLSGFDGTLASVPGNPLWAGLADGSTVDSLFNDPFSDGFSGGGTVTDSDGLPTGTTDAFSTIGTRLVFSLSPMDSVTFTGAFAVVPSPASLALLAVAGLIGGARRRRRA